MGITEGMPTRRQAPGPLAGIHHLSLAKCCCLASIVYTMTERSMHVDVYTCQSKLATAGYSLNINRIIAITEREKSSFYT
ncbi:hypothetical protein [Endozoicomonas atrinae]|uniref:hypothetical protein n=1 Tax=Endozoicomonas atrinae TaxID=1333660 RepID=UPI00082485A7|nr:hypothetical protein [Endozoicomonas atrinae]